jgi:hypothetical protein
VKREFGASHASADAMRYAGLVASILLSGSSFVIVHVVVICGLLFSPQQSCTAVVPGSALNPTGHVWHPIDPVAFWNVSGGQATQDVLPVSV